MSCGQAVLPHAATLGLHECPRDRRDPLYLHELTAHFVVLMSLMTGSLDLLA